MGLETAAALAMGGGALFGAVGQDRANARNTRAQQQARAQLQGMVQPYLTQPGAGNPYAQQIQDFIKNGIYGTTPGSYNPATVTAPPPVGTEAFNPGQDALLQMMRAAPGYQANASLDQAIQGILTGKPFDTTEQFNTLGALSEQDLTRQVAGLRGGAASLGQRFGTAGQGAEAMLRSTAATNLAAQRAAISQGAYNQNQANVLAGAGLAGGQNQAMNQFLLNAYQSQIGAAQAAGQLGIQGRQITGQEQQFNVGQLMQALLANQGAQNQAGQFNAGQSQQNNQFLNQFIMQALMGAGNLQQGQNNQNAQLLGLLAGQQVPQNQPSAIPGAIGDIGQLALLLPFLRQMGAGGGGGGFSPVPTVPQVPIPGIPSVTGGYGGRGGFQVPLIMR